MVEASLENNLRKWGVLAMSRSNHHIRTDVV